MEDGEPQEVTIEQAFKDEDKDGDGRINATELKALLQMLDMTPTVEECENLINRVAPSDNGTLDYNQFANLVNALAEQQQNEDVVEQSVNRYLIKDRMKKSKRLLKSQRRKK